MTDPTSRAIAGTMRRTLANTPAQRARHTAQPQALQTNDMVQKRLSERPQGPEDRPPFPGYVFAGRDGAGNPIWRPAGRARGWPPFPDSEGNNAA